MAYPLTTITASTIGNSGANVDTKTRAGGALCVFNASQVVFLVKDSFGSQLFLSNNFADKFSFPEGGGSFTLTPQFTVVSNTNNPDKVAFIVLSAEEDKKDRRVWPFALGTSVGVTTVTNVQNDGNNAGTVFVEGTAMGDTPSDITITNDGRISTKNFIDAQGYQITGRKGFGAAFPAITWNTANRDTEYWSPQSGTAAGHSFITWDGALAKFPFSVGGQFGGAPSWVDNAGVYNWTASGIGGTFPHIFTITPSGATVNNTWALAYSGPDGELDVLDVTNSKTVLQYVPNAGINIPSGPISNLGGQATAGSFGVPLSVATPQEVTVVVNTQTTILSFTTPNDGKNHLIRTTADFRIGAGNTNQGTITYGVHYTDDSGNTGSLSFVNAATNAVYLGLVLNKGLSYHAFSTAVLVAPNSVVQFNYTNAAAGTISDHVTGYLELLT